MPRVRIPNSAGLHTLRHFLSLNQFFSGQGDATLELHAKWVHVEPIVLVMLAAWGAWCRRSKKAIKTKNLRGTSAEFLWRMHLFDHMDIAFKSERIEHEEAGRFVPLTNVRKGLDVGAAIGSISALLHLQEDPDTLSAVQYCISELLRNVLEHSASPDGAFVCARNYRTGTPPRVTIAVADCGSGIAQHLGQKYPAALESDSVALQLSMLPGVTGARPGAYGTPDNQGVGLFVTRCIAKGTGGYFAMLSGKSCYRQRRARDAEEQTQLFHDPFDERHDLWELDEPWLGTVVALEIRSDQIGDFNNYFSWIRDKIPARTSAAKRIRFT